LYTADPRKDPNATFVHEALAARRSSRRWRAPASIGRGGMLTKILAAKRAAKSGAHTTIASGARPMCWAAGRGEAIGTQLLAPTARWPRASNGWPITCARRVVIDAGAVEKLTSGGKSCCRSA
jgi:glutamate 5-kinase